MTHAATATLHILVVDDAPFDQRLLVDLLTDHGYDVMVAASGTQGYQLALASQPDLVIMDARMPDMDGFTCCRLLHANRSTCELPIIFLSARTVRTTGSPGSPPARSISSRSRLSPMSCWRASGFTWA